MSLQTPSETETTFERRCELLRVAFESYHLPLLCFVRGMTRHHQDAENIIQDLWRYVMQNFSEDTIQSKGMLYAKARHLTIDYYRKRKRSPEQGAEELEEWHMPKQHQEAYTTKEEERLKASFFERFDGVLSEKQADVFWLHARYGFTYSEIEQMIGISVSTIGDYVTAARRKLAAHIEQGGNNV